jgi:ATP-binding cassette subfamily B protein
MNKHEIILPPMNKAPTHTQNILPWIWYFLSPYKLGIIGFYIFRVFRYTIQSLPPIVIGYVINGLETGIAQENPQHFWTILGVFGVLYLISLYNIIHVAESAMYEKAIRGMTLYGIRQLNRLSLNWHEKEGSGGKLQRVMTGRKGLQDLTRHIRWDFMPLIGNIVAIIISYIFMDLPLIFLPFYLAFIATYLLSTWYFARNYFQLFDEFNEKFEKLLSGVYEFISAIRTAKAFHLSHYIENKAKGLEEEGQQSIMTAYRSNLIRWTICNFVAAFWLFLFAGVGFHLVLNDQMTIGIYTASFFLAYRVWNSCEVVGSILEKVYEHGNGIHRLVQTLCVTPKNLDLEPSQTLNKNWKNISLRNLSYVYEGNETQGVKDISFNVKRGQKIAFVGGSGAGKSTLVKLLMKQMLANSGKFQIDNQAVSHIPTEQWLSQIGFVPQDVELFNLSIRDNIIIDRDDIDDKFLSDILEQAALSEFINSLPEGLDTIIGERGIKLSGGQRQRLGIARALVRQAPIIIFDEATSSLDSISESKIQTAIENSFEDRTVFVIAHRLSTIRNVDHIIVLSEGRIIEQGNFEDLINENGHFAKLWEIQSKAQKNEVL